ncbi:unnamed protein product [Mytilus coruscus]|uniref:Uncharacterized protein n=1 Tax=Mytilus coruscus TaxID=42192 RepID=A0A6J8BRQ0_MYTCO|nr:unnamed protein product [Mytilus coruscus]
MEHLDILSFDPLNPQLADTYVQSVLTPFNVSKVTTTAEIHPEKNWTSKKLKFLVNDDHEDIIRLTQSTHYKDNSICINEHNSSDFSELKSLFVGLTGSMNSFCQMITQRMDNLEKTIPNTIATLIDSKISSEMQKVKQQFQKELKTVSDKVENIEKSYANVAKQQPNMDEAIRIIVRNLPESNGENVLNKVNALIKDGLHLKDVKAVSADRKKSYKEGKYDVVVVVFKSMNDKRKVMDKKRDLKDSRNFKDIFIENDLSKSQRILNNNLRNIVNAIGENRLEIKGGRVRTRESRFRDNRIDSNPRRSENQKRDHLPMDEEYENRNYNSQGYNSARGENRRGKHYKSGLAQRNLHILGIAETHLMGSNSVNVDGYCWYGHNRRNIHIRAKNGSGGVGLLVRNDFDQQFHIEIVDDNTDGIIVTRATTIIQSLGEPGRYDLRKIVPDHSLLTWNMCLFFTIEDQVSKNKDKNQTVMKIKYDTKSVPEDWLSGESVVTEINRVILQLEQSEASQQNIDKMYENFVSVLKAEMSEKLQSKEIRISNAFNNKARKCKKPWWNSELTMLWNDVCKAEKNWNKCRLSSKKRELRHIFVQKRKLFDRGVQRSKRQYWHSMQEELINSQGNPKEFWRKIGRIGVGSERQNTIPMEIKLNDGSICDDKDIVINKWKCDFEEMLNKNSDTSISNEIENCNSDIICVKY